MDENCQAAIDSVHASYRGEIARLKMQLVLYRKALIEAGVEPPDTSGEDLLELLRVCNRVVSSASEVVHVLGSSRELTVGF